MRVAVCEYEAGNVGSVVLACERLGAVQATSDPEMVERADLAVLPGVGSARPPSNLAARGLDDALHDRFIAGRPTLGICLGLQLALESSDEDGGVRGLGLLPGRAVRLRGRIPRVGWARVDRAARCSTSHTRTPRRHPPQPRAPRASSPSPNAGASSASSSIRRRAAEQAPASWTDASSARSPASTSQAGASSRESVSGSPRRRRPGRAGRGLLESGADELVFLDVSATVQGRDMLWGSSAGWPSGWQFPSRSAASGRSATPRRCSKPGPTRSP